MHDWHSFFVIVWEALAPVRTALYTILIVWGGGALFSELVKFVLDKMSSRRSARQIEADRRVAEQAKLEEEKRLLAARESSLSDRESALTDRILYRESDLDSRLHVLRLECDEWQTRHRDAQLQITRDMVEAQRMMIRYEAQQAAGVAREQDISLLLAHIRFLESRQKTCEAICPNSPWPASPIIHSQPIVFHAPVPAVEENNHAQ